MSKKELIEKLKECENNSDTEAAHSVADTLLLEFINDPDINEAYNKIEKWYA